MGEEILVRDMARPPGIEASRWEGVMDRLGDRVIATVLESRAITITTPEGDQRTLIEHVLDCNRPVYDLIMAEIHAAISGIPTVPEEDESAPWKPEEDSPWEPKEDEREFGPQGDWWK